ncbi:hypothetical protein F7725_004087 [Dissostichus mawsoni]|uniref:Ig-like domain-containing protein n=1 Tax=Dissostichus mawsoni TaxID=36200 RepID=A0A7J5YE09_DISMA|nr:hypothetical protein F7725_004087 [Dissostichus mawsoni]
MDNDRGRYQVVKNTSALRISNFSTTDLGDYNCLLLNQQQCVSSETVDYRLITETIYLSVEDTAVLQCPVTGFSEDKPPYWETDLFNNHQGQDNLSVGVVDQNYSLVLTSVTLNHSELFSEGEEVTLRCKDKEKGWYHYWFFKSNRTKGRTFNAFYNQIRSIVRMESDGRLVISDVSLQDTGEYWCAVDDEYDQCMFSSKTVLKHRDPFGVHSTFYAVRCSALCCCCSVSLYANPQVHRITSTQLTGRFNTGLKCAQTKTPGVLFNHQMALCKAATLQTATLGCVLVCVLSYLYLNGNVGDPEANPLPSQNTKSKESTSLKDGMHLSSRFSATQRPLASGFRGAVQTQSKGVATTQSQYPIQGFKVRPMTPTFIPGMLHRTVCPFITLHCDTTEGCLALHAEQRSNYTVSLEVSKGVLRTTIPAKGVQVIVTGNGESRLMVESSSLEALNELLADVSYTSTIYHIHTGDLATFQFEDHEAVFPITIKQPQPPVLYDMGRDINSQVTITTKTFLRYPELKSIREFYKDIEIIIADDSMEPEKIPGPHIQQFIMPPAQGWFAGRNLAVSQVTTKYFLWVDDDFLFTKLTKIEELVKVMEANPELDVLGGKVQGDQFYFSLIYEEGDEVEGGCMYRKSRGRFHSLPGYPQCSVVNGVVNFFLARTDAVQRVGFDPQLKRLAHSEFFMDGLGSLMVATCGHVSVSHQARLKHKDTKLYQAFRHPPKSDLMLRVDTDLISERCQCLHNTHEETSEQNGCSLRALRLLFALISNIHAEELIVIRRKRLFHLRAPRGGRSCLISRFLVRRSWSCGTPLTSGPRTPQYLKT